MLIQSLLAAVLLSSIGLCDQQPLNPRPQSHTQGYVFKPLLHLPGISPYFDAIGFGLEHKSPLNCTVTAASYLVRHAAIYANDVDYDTYMEPFLLKLNSSDKSLWTGPLSIFRDWKTPITNPKKQLEQITPQGFKDAVKVGKHLLQRYPDIVPTTRKVYADKKRRTQDTAEAFVQAFPQPDVEIVQITFENEFHSQVPHKSCPAFTKKAGDDELKAAIEHYTRPIISRLSQFVPTDVELTPYDVVGMQQWCGYESAIRGKVSEICGVFTDVEWLGYEYAWDLKYNYMVGPRNPLSNYLGFPWLNTTAALFSKLHRIEAGVPIALGKKEDQRFFVSFTHREVPPFIATALGLYNTVDTFPTDRINYSRAWRMAELIPFLGHVGIEKMTCDGMGFADGGEEQEFVRIIANTAPRPIPDCQDGPGGSCRFESFVALVKGGMETYGDFHGACGDKKDEKSKKEMTWDL